MNVWNEVASIAIKLVFAVISVIFTTTVVPWIKNTVTPWLKQKYLYSVVKSYVNAAEKLAETGMIEKIDKKGYVVSLLTSAGVNVTSDIDALIESAVKELDMQIESILTQVSNAITCEDDISEEESSAE